MLNFVTTPTVLINNIFENANDAIAVFDQRFELRFRNSAANRLLDHFFIGDIRNAIKTYISSERHQYARSNNTFANAIDHPTARHLSFSAPIVNSKSGLTSYFEFSTSSFIDENNQTWISTIIRDVSARVRCETELRRLSHCDDLTSIANRRGFYQEVERLGGKSLVVALFDLDHFKAINDTHGHAIGDQVLIHFSQEFLSKLPSATIVARLGGEEFVAAFSIDDSLVAIEEIKIYAIATHSKLNEYIPNYTFSVGVSFANKLDDISNVLQQADNALYAAKSLGRNRVVLSTNENISHEL
jgi:diguanylate cyclase (GGDEF)-like protein